MYVEGYVGIYGVRVSAFESLGLKAKFGCFMSRAHIGEFYRVIRADTRSLV